MSQTSPEYGTPGTVGAPEPAVQDATYPPRPPRRGATGRVLGTAGVVLALVAVGYVALILADLMMSETTTTRESYDAVTTVELVADDDVTVGVAEGDIEVDVIAHSGLREPRYTENVSANRIELTHRCGGWSIATARCSGELDVTVPAGTEVVVRTENGDVVASGLAGEVSLRSSNGRIEAFDIGGQVTAESSNGDIDVTDTRADVEAVTSNGEISVLDVDGSVTADSSNGRITIDAVTGDVSAGTSNGSVEISAVGGNVDGESSNGHVTMIGDGEPVALTMETSNGDEVVKGPVDPDAERTVELRSSNGEVAYLDE